MIIVSDTSPINNLAAIEQMELLQQLYGNIIIPTAVYQEIINAGTTDPGTFAVRVVCRGYTDSWRIAIAFS